MLYRPIFRWALPVLLRRIFAIVLVSLHFLILSSVCNSQSAGLPDAGNVGTPINGVFSGGTIDSVQLNNGNLHIDIPLLEIPGIGIPIKIHFIYDSKIWNYSSSPNGNTGTSDYAVFQDRTPSILTYPGAVSTRVVTSTPIVTCGNQQYPDNFLNSLTFLDENGTAHVFNGSGYSATSPPCDYNPAPTLMYAADSSGIVGNRAANSVGLANAITKDGTKYTFLSGGVSVEDANGNELTMSTSAGTEAVPSPEFVPSPPNAILTTLTDTMGRKFYLSTSDKYNNQPIAISYTDQNGAPQTITISYIAANTSTASLCALSGGSTCFPSPGPGYYPSVITLQDGSTYTFAFQPNSPADLASLTLPTGGVLSWTYGQTDVSGDKVLTRTVTANNQSSLWKYSYVMSSSQGPNSSNVVTVTDPALNDTQYTCTILKYQAGAQLPPCYMTKEQVFNGSASGGSVAVTKTTSYNITGTVLPAKSTVSWPATGQVAETDTNWDSIPNSGNDSGVDNPAVDTSRGNMLSQMDYDYGSGAHGALLRNTQYSYLYQQNSSYIAPNITGLVAQTSIYNSATMNSSTLVAQTTTAYDQFNQKSINGQSGLSSTTGTTNHDYTNFSKSATLRGLPTSVSQHVGPSSSVVRYTNYNDLGSPTITTDPLLNSTTYSYGTENAFLASTTYPSTNSVSHIITTVYDTNLGLLMSEKDQNGQSTTFTYDARMRPLSTTYPDNGNTTLSYPDSNHIDSAVLQTPNPTKTSVIVLDGLGRQSETQLTSDPSGTDYVDTTYDALGRVASVSNQYRATNDTTYGITSYLYDPLGRLSFQCQPDNSTSPSTTCTIAASYQQWNYSGNVVTFRDENGNLWTRTSDALGRLTNVAEPAGQQTVYTYDALNDLRTVAQNGMSGDTPRNRSFTYDSLSRLLCASNPENSTATCPASPPTSGPWPSGPTLYSYDANGNVLTKTDARGIATNYSYDALNRLLSKSYTIGGALMGTPASCFFYDGGATNGVGRLTSEWTQSGSCPVPDAVPSSGFFTLRSILAYDPTGRISSEQQCTPGSCTTSSGPQLWYGYDLAGDPTCLINSAGSSAGSLTQTPCLGTSVGTPSGLQLITGFDSAAHMNSVTSNWTALPTPVYTLPAGGYGPVGPLNWTLGPSLSVTQSYTNRLWTQSITAAGQVP